LEEDQKKKKEPNWLVKGTQLLTKFVQSNFTIKSGLLRESYCLRDKKGSPVKKNIPETSDLV